MEERKGYLSAVINFFSLLLPFLLQDTSKSQDIRCFLPKIAKQYSYEMRESEFNGKRGNTQDAGKLILLNIHG